MAENHFVALCELSYLMLFDLTANFRQLNFSQLQLARLMKNNEKLLRCYSHIVQFQFHRNPGRSTAIQKYFCRGLAAFCATTGTYH